MRYAGIDIGTNSMRLIIIDISNNEFRPVYRQFKTTRIGKDLHKNGFLLDEKIDENTEVFLSLKKICDEYSCDKIISFATEAVRCASNGNVLTERIYKSSGIRVRIISGEEEAKLTFDGAVYSVDKKIIDRKVSVIDIGGGSTEIGYGEFDGSAFVLKKGISFPVGCVNMTEKFYTGGYPVNKNNLMEMGSFIDRKINDLKLDLSESRIIGVGGTLTCLYAIKNDLKKYDPAIIHNKEITADDIENIYCRLLDMPIEEREKLPGLNDNRGDIIIAGLYILQSAMRKFKINKLIISEYGIIVGAVLNQIAG